MARKGHFHGRKMLRANLDLPLPSGDLAAWHELAGRIVRVQRQPVLSGWVSVTVRAGPLNASGTLEEVVAALLALLAEHRVLEADAEVAALSARWDRTIPVGRVHIEVRTSIAPAMRIGRETREKIAVANGRRASLASP
jgi:hypothetical protein